LRAPAVADPADDDRSERAGEEADPKGPERQQQLAGAMAGGKDRAPDLQREVREDDQIVEGERIAEADRDQPGGAHA